MNSMTALYIRTARNDVKPEEKNSISSQRSLLLKYAAEHGFETIKEYVDDGYLGNNMNRPGFKAMLNDIENGLINTVIVTDLSRLGRNSALVSYYTELYFHEQNVRFVSVKDDIDTINGTDALSPFYAIMNEFYAQELRSKIRNFLRGRP